MPKGMLSPVQASGQQPKPFQQSRWQIASIRNDSITGQQVSARFRGGTNETSRAIRERPTKSPGQRREKMQGQDQNNYRAPRSSRSQVGASRPSQWQTNIETDATRGKLSKRESKRAKNDDFERLAKVGYTQANTATLLTATEMIHKARQGYATANPACSVSLRKRLMAKPQQQFEAPVSITPYKLRRVCVVQQIDWNSISRSCL